MSSESQPASEVSVAINGGPVTLAARATVADAIRAAGCDPDGRGVAVAVDGEVVPRAEWSSTGLAAGARVEVVHAVQGG